MRLPPSSLPAARPALARSLGSALLLAAVLAGCSSPPPPPAPPAAPIPMADLGPVPVAATCARPNEKEAFEVAGLKSRLMVAALSCGSQAQYNAFIRQNRPALVSQETTLSSYFFRAYGRGRTGQQHLDSYKTELANVQQQMRSRDPQFCSVSDSLFGRAATLHTAADIGPLAASTPIAQPLAVTTCN